MHLIFMLSTMLHYYMRAVHGMILAKLSENVDRNELAPIVYEKRFGLEEVGQHVII